MLLRRKKLESKPGGFAIEGAGIRGLPDVYRGGNSPFFKDIYDSDHVEQRQGGRFRWLLSTCLAATVGAIAILVVVYGSADTSGLDDGLLPEFQNILEGRGGGPVVPSFKNADGLKWVSPKMDRLQLTTGALSTRYIIHESSKQRRDGREYMRQRPYARIVARLAPVRPTTPTSFHRSILSNFTRAIAPSQQTTATRMPAADWHAQTCP